MNKTEFRVEGVPLNKPQPSPQPNPAPTPDDPSVAPKTLEEQVVDALRTVYDPEVPVNIYDLGLIYSIDIDPASKVRLRMTLTSPACPVAESLPGEVRAAVNRVPQVVDCEIDLVWDPPWGPDKMSDVAKLKLGLL